MTPTPDKAAAKRSAAERQTAIPANVKQPSDHRPPQDDVDGPPDLHLVWHGNEYDIAGENLDDVEVLEYLTDDNFVGALRLMLGDKGWADYKANERNDRGKVTASGAAEFLNHILTVGDRKN